MARAENHCCNHLFATSGPEFWLFTRSASLTRRGLYIVSLALTSVHRGLGGTMARRTGPLPSFNHSPLETLPNNVFSETSLSFLSDLRQVWSLKVQSGSLGLLLLHSCSLHWSSRSPVSYMEQGLRYSSVGKVAISLAPLCPKSSHHNEVYWPLALVSSSS